MMKAHSVAKSLLHGGERMKVHTQLWLRATFSPVRNSKPSLAKDRVDPGFFGDGFYFSQNPIYSRKYEKIKGAEDGALMMCWLLLGNVQFCD
jgi:hypothetical protein